MIKWDKPDMPNQSSSDGKYCITHAVGDVWCAYKANGYGGLELISECLGEEDARRVCEQDSRRAA